MIRQVWSRLQLLFAQGVGHRVTHDKIQVSVFEDDAPPNVDRVEPYGFSYRPKPGCQAYLVFPSGDRSHGIALVVGDRKFNMTLAEGEVAIHDDEGNHVHIQRDGVIEVKAKTKVLADTPLFETTQHCKIGGNLEVAGNTLTHGGNTANSGFYGAGGGAAECKSGLRVTNGGVHTDSLRSDTAIVDPHKHDTPCGLSGVPIA